MLKFGLRAHDFLITDDINLLATKISDSDVHLIQFANGISIPKDSENGTKISQELGEKVQDVLKDNDIEISVLSCYINLIDPNKENEKKNVKQFKKYIDNAAYYGASLVATEPGSLDPEFNQTELNYQEDVVNHTISNVKELILKGESKSIDVGIEAGVNHPIHSLATIQQLINEVDSDKLRIIFDPVNLLDKNNKNDLYEILKNGLKQFGEKIHAIHVKDYIFDDEKEIVTPGSGCVDFSRMFKIINKYIPDALIILDESPRNDLEQGVKLLQNEINKLNGK